MKFTKKDIGSDSGGGNFLKLKDGESIKGVCRGEVYEFKIIWESGKSKVVGNNDLNGKHRYRCNFVISESGKFVAKIWEFGITINNMLADLSEEYDLTETKIKISRVGTGKETQYTIMPLAKDLISSKDLTEIDQISLNVLEHKQKPQDDMQRYASEVDEDEPLPF